MLRALPGVRAILAVTLSRWREPRELQYEKVSYEGFDAHKPLNSNEWLEPHPSRAGTFTSLRHVPSETWRPVYPLPPVILVTDRLSGNLDSGLMALHCPEDLGYMFLERVPWYPATRYVRGRWLWWLHRAGGWLWHMSWLAWPQRLRERFDTSSDQKDQTRL